MIKAMFNATSGMSASQEALTTISNNIANSQTTGFKAQKTQFEEVFYQQMKAPSAPGNGFSGTNPIDLGNGVRVVANVNDFSQGNINYTGNKNDLAIQGEGFFVLGNADASDKIYTKSGNFDLSKDNELITKNGLYVLGWNADNSTGSINTGATLSPIKLPIGEVGQPTETTEMKIEGNLDISMEVGEMNGFQVSSYDRLGVRHDIDMTYVKTGGNTFRYLAVPTDQFKPSASIENAVLRTNENVASMLQKGEYNIDSVASATPGMIDIVVTDPSGGTVLTQTVSDVDQTITLNDGTNNWFTINYKGGNAPSSSSFTVGEVGDITYDSIGQIQSMTGSGPSGEPVVSYTPVETGQTVNIQVEMNGLKGLAADSILKMTNTNGMPASVLTNYSITDGGVINGYFSDGSIRPIAQISMATFSNPSGLTRVGQGNYLPTPNSGVPDVGLPNSSSRGQIKAQALESSNVDLAEEFVSMLEVQKMFQSNTKVIQSANQIVTDVINLIR